MIVKVSVESYDGKSHVLYDYDKSISMERNVAFIREKFKMPLKTNVYGLKIIQTNNGKTLNLYVTDHNSDLIKDGYFLKVTHTVQHQVSTLFLLLENGDRKTCFEHIMDLYPDEEFIKELVNQEKHLFIVNYFTTEENLTSTETVACLLTIIHLYKKRLIEATPELLDKLRDILKSSQEVSAIKYTLSLVYKILLSQSWNEWILNEIPPKQLMAFMRIRDKDLQYLSLALVNAMVKNCSGNRKLQYIKELNFKQNRSDIYKNVIETGNVDSNTRYELYVYQTHLLSLYNDALTSKTKLDKTKMDEFKINDTHQIFSKRLSNMIGFEENVTRIRQQSIDDLLEIIDMKDAEEISLSETDLEISYLAYGALSYYKKYHYKNFCQTQIDETYFGPGLFATSESVVKILAEILHVGKDPELCKKGTFQPTIFNASTKIPFFYELFARSMWILSKTKSEMKSNGHEYKKVMNVLKKQISMVLEKQPKDFKSLTNLLIRTDYRSVRQRWQLECRANFKSMIENNSSVQEIKQKFLEINENIVIEQRLNYLIKGSVFYQVNEFKKIDHCFIKLFGSKKQLALYLYDEKSKTKKEEPKIINISNITYLVEGKACPHKNNALSKDRRLIFSLIVEDSTNYYINLIAKDLLECFYWLDGLHVLLGNENRSEAFHKELDQLVDMDLSLHLLDLPDVSIPRKPPPIPPLPLDIPTQPPLPKKMNNF